MKQLQGHLHLAVAALGRRVETQRQPSEKVSEAIAVFTRWTNEIDALCADGDLCGPTMDPLN